MPALSRAAIALSLLGAGLLACSSSASSPNPSRMDDGGAGTVGVAGAGGTAGSGGLNGGPLDGGASGGTNAAAAGDAMTSGAGAAGNAGDAGAPSPHQPTFILGADVSWLLEDEAGGATYYDGGKQLDLLALLQARGFNYIRVRTFVNPAAAGGYAAGKPEAWCDLEHTIELAQRVKQRDMGLLLDFHYSDNWADPAKQQKPAAWAELPFEALVTAVHDYPLRTLSALRDAGALPELVQLGNEITPGVLFPDGSSETRNFPRLGQLLKAGARAVAEVDPSIRVMLHIEKCGDLETSRWWIDHALTEKIPFQILGQSCYTEHQGPVSGWQATFAELATRYPTLSFMIAEYSHEKRAANDLMHGMPDRRGLGTFIWEPTRWMEAVFDRDGQRYVANQHLDVYSQIATDYGL
jgi:arabinogalactan endo-1,4-beta-galactosidase